MTTTVSPLTKVVKIVSDDSCKLSCSAWAMGTLLDRLEEIAAAAGGQRALSRKAGLDEKHVGVIVHRLRKKADSTVEHDTLIALARAAGVTLEWLAKGDGACACRQIRYTGDDGAF